MCIRKVKYVSKLLLPRHVFISPPNIDDILVALCKVAQLAGSPTVEWSSTSLSSIN